VLLGGRWLSSGAEAGADAWEGKDGVLTAEVPRERCPAGFHALGRAVASGASP